MREEIFKGATRPALVFGVPLVPAVLVGGLGILLTTYAFVLARSLVIAGALFIVVAAAWIWMYLVTRRDDQRLMQQLLRLRMRQSPAGLRVWGGRLSYASHALRNMTDRPRK